ncbi:MAG: DUF6789 family protein [Candidatus Hydrothermarchaeota archaeon]
MEDRSEAALTLLAILCGIAPLGTFLLGTSGLIIPTNSIVLTLPLSLLVFLGIVYYGHTHQMGGFLRRLMVGLMAGVLGTVAMDILVSLGSAVAGYRAPDLPSILGVLLLGTQAPELSIWLVGRLYHYSNGAALGMIYALLFVRVRWFLGLGYGLALWALLMLTPPMLVMGYALGGNGTIPAFALISLASHLAYGAVLGLSTQRYAWEGYPSGKAPPR